LGDLPPPMNTALPLVMIVFFVIVMFFGPAPM
jgi:hypothetical protein